jgi:hypothetical protein
MVRRVEGFGYRYSAQRLPRNQSGRRGLRADTRKRCRTEELWLTHGRHKTPQIFDDPAGPSGGCARRTWSYPGRLGVSSGFLSATGPENGRSLSGLPLRPTTGTVGHGVSLPDPERALRRRVPRAAKDQATDTHGILGGSCSGPSESRWPWAPSVARWVFLATDRIQSMTWRRDGSRP